MPTLLLFVDKKNPILRETMPAVKDFKDQELQDIIEDMCFSILPEQLKKAHAAHESAAGMAANQWGLKRRIFIYSPKGSEKAANLEVMINPSYIPYLQPGQKQSEMVAAYEGCFSVPLTTCLVNRHEAISATYYTPKGKKISCILRGWEARVFQHETDHLNGKLMDGKLDDFEGPECLERLIFKNREELNDFYQNRVKPEREI